MKAKALVRFCIGNITTTAQETIIDFTDAPSQMNMLLRLGWIELLEDVPTA